MATLRFKQPSPYTQKPAGPPKDDEIYHGYLKRLHANSANTNKVYGFALFAVGRAGTIHLDFLIKSSRVDLLYIVEDDKSKWDKLKRFWNLQTVKFVTSKEADVVYKNPKVHAVVVCTPTFAHEEIVKNALSHNKAVFCEKPIAETMDRTEACYKKAAEVNQPLFSAFNRRFDPAYKSARSRVREGEVGHVLTIKVCSRDSPLPSLDYLKISGGIFHDCAVHDIDMVLYILGEYPSKVSAIAKANIPEIAAINDFDTVAIIMSFDSGTIAVIDLSRHSTYGYDQRLEIFGQTGMIKVENKQQLHNLETYKHEGVGKVPIDYSFPSRYSQGYEREMEHFLNVLQGTEKLSVDVNDTLAVSKIAAACEESARSGRTIDLMWAPSELSSL